MPTARDLIISAYRASGMRGAIETPSDKETEAGLELLNMDLIDMLRLDQAYPACIKTYLFNVEASSKNIYSIGIDNGIDPVDIPITQEIVRIEQAQVAIGNVWQPLRQITAEDYYRMSIANVSVLPTQFAFNRTRDPYDQFILTYPSSGSYTIRLAVQGTVENYALDDVIALPSGYFSTMKYGLATLLTLGSGLTETQDRMNQQYTKCLRAIKQVTTTRPPKLKIDGSFGMYNIYTDQAVYPASGGI